MSEVVNELLRTSLRSEADILNLVLSRKIARTTAKEFEEFRKELSERLEF
jgi:hypothetical protein